jgi:hypothetical protein
VALRDSAAATDFIRKRAGDPDDEIQDMGRVSDDLLKFLNLQPGEFIRADATRPHPEAKKTNIRQR